MPEQSESCSCATCTMRRKTRRPVVGNALAVRRSLFLPRFCARRRHASAPCSPVRATSASSKILAACVHACKIRKIFGRSYVAQKIALFRTAQRLCRHASVRRQDYRPRRAAHRTHAALRSDSRVFRQRCRRDRRAPSRRYPTSACRSPISRVARQRAHAPDRRRRAMPAQAWAAAMRALPLLEARDRRGAPKPSEGRRRARTPRPPP